jgi:dolichyl-diphosphooligosaccharide--protein glycosyltransferase
VLFTTVTILFLILAIKSAKKRQLVVNHVKGRDWEIIRKPLVYSLLVGISLGIYLLTWVGGLFFIFLLFIYFVIQFIIDHLRGENTDYLVIIGTLSMLITTIIGLPLLIRTWWLSQLYLPSFTIATLTPLVLTGISRLLTRRRIKPIYYPLTLFGLGLAGLAIFYIVNPSVLESMLGKFGLFTAAGASLPILETQPLLFPMGNFSLSVVWNNFTTGFFLSIVALVILIYLIVKHSSADKNLLVVWSLGMLAATIGQRRFGYYFAVNVSLLTGFLSWQILQFAGFKKMTARPVETLEMAERKKAKRKKPPKAAGSTTGRVSAALGIVVVFFLVFFPNISSAVTTAKQPRFAPDDTWYEALIWLKENTPEPFGSPDAYYELYEPPLQQKDYEYPESAYGVMSWWVQGHWITRIAHRIPVSNPFQGGAEEAGRFFIAQDETSANSIMDEMSSRFVVIDHYTALAELHTMAAFAGSSTQKFYESYFEPQNGQLRQRLLFYPEYYQSLATRLANFDGREVAAESPIVISYEDKTNTGGTPYKYITNSQSFPSYEEAKAYISNQNSENYRIVGTKPLVSPVPLAALEHYKLIYTSKTRMLRPGIGTSSVKIFEYVK